MEEQYETAGRWLDLVAHQNPDHIIKKGLSDHEALTPTPAPPLVTPLYFQSARLLSKMARALGKETKAKGVLSSYMNGETAVFHVDSGKYQFLSKLPK
ncbi:MAG: hypothetical protein KAW19_02600 [Candidatus Aminicenantes bacterium]|nr:hypothetical protein [Candidatus Aminicenantes bacterium]